MWLGLISVLVLGTVVLATAAGLRWWIVMLVIVTIAALTMVGFRAAGR